MVCIPIYNIEPGSLREPRHYDSIPDEFPLKPTSTVALPSRFPALAPPSVEDVTARTAVYEKLDSNVGAEIMAFSHAPLPLQNSATSVLRLGQNNASRPFQVVQKYLETLFQEYRHLVSLNTTVERAEKKGDQWVLSLRQPGHAEADGQLRDFWWQETFDAIVVASGHYNIGAIPNVPGLDGTYKKVPTAFEHSKSYRSADNYVSKVRGFQGFSPPGITSNIPTESRCSRG
jgi:hypothetical protein